MKKWEKLSHFYNFIFEFSTAESEVAAVNGLHDKQLESHTDWGETVGKILISLKSMLGLAQHRTETAFRSTVLAFPGKLQELCKLWLAKQRECCGRTEKPWTAFSIANYWEICTDSLNRSTFLETGWKFSSPVWRQMSLNPNLKAYQRVNEILWNTAASRKSKAVLWNVLHACLKLEVQLGHGSSPTLEIFQHSERRILISHHSNSLP